MMPLNRSINENKKVIKKIDIKYIYKTTLHYKKINIIKYDKIVDFLLFWVYT